MLAAATVLGSGGFVPTERRETSSVLLLPEDSAGAVLIDAGTGMRRLVTDGALLQGRTRIDVVLTHFHIDHVCGLPYLTELPGCQLTIHGPGAALYGTPTKAILARVFSPPIMPVRPEELGVDVGEIAPGTVTVGDLELQVRRQDEHTNPTLGLRVGDELVWCTDTGYDAGTIDFARGARVLAHDAWEPPPAPGHASPAEAARLATQAGVPTAVLIHVPPRADEQQMHEQASAEHPHVVVATDGLDLLAL